MDADIYVLANNRSPNKIIEILDKYLPQRTYAYLDEDGKYQCWNDRFDEDDKLPDAFEDHNLGIFRFDTELELFEFLDDQSSFDFRPSYRPIGDSDIRVIVLYYFEDGSLVFGLNIYQDTDREDRLLDQLKKDLGSAYGYISYHVPPAEGRSAFIELSLRV